VQKNWISYMYDKITRVVDPAPVPFYGIICSKQVFSKKGIFMAIPSKKTKAVDAQIPSALYPILWDINIESVDINQHKTFIIERILNYGDEDCYRWMFITCTEKEITKVVRNSRRISRKTATMMANYYNIPKGEIRCLNQASNLDFYPF